MRRAQFSMTSIAEGFPREDGDISDVIYGSEAGLGGPMTSYNDTSATRLVATALDVPGRTQVPRARSFLNLSDQAGSPRGNGRPNRLSPSHDLPAPNIAPQQRRSRFSSRWAKLGLGACALALCLLVANVIVIGPTAGAPIMPEQAGSQHNYGLLVDAGSSGSRLYIYTWPEHTGRPDELLQMTAHVDARGEALVMKVEPGLSSYADNITGAYESLRPLLDFASQHVPADRQALTPLYVLATAGLRMLPEATREAMLGDIVARLPSNYRFQFNRGHADIISGKMEGVYAWITTNYLLNRFKHDDKGRLPTVGVVDMGGASTQISFEIPSNISLVESTPDGNSDMQTGLPAENIIDIDLGCGLEKSAVDGGHGQESMHKYRVYSVTYLGYGANVARDRYVETLFEDKTAWRADTKTPSVSGLVTNGNTPSANPSSLPMYVRDDPCLPVGMEDPAPSPAGDNSRYVLVGTGQFQQCRDSMKPLLNISTQCSLSPTCSFNGVFQPPIDFASAEFWGLSEFWYTINDIFLLGNQTYDHEVFDRVAANFCSTPWPELQRRFNEGMYPGAMERRVAHQCYKAAWITATLHHGHRFPLDYPLRPVSKLDGVEVQWTLGAMLYLTRFQPLGKIQNLKASEAARPTSLVRFLPSSPLAWLGAALISLLAAVVLVRTYLNRRYSRVRIGKLSPLAKSGTVFSWMG
eukprot:comp19396_c1_seq1/m.22437 comp19396_c1_seq1/g.22437  ORF comp19396_c1_seq1/g.22437 comp19396_c1_seq1/m.22437 type:complete len:695 (-) comp19396_c1_seq1:148-2232(-)